MRGLALMVRSAPFPSAPCRKPKPKLKEQTIFQRKETKRLANVNTWSTDYTNEKIPEWVDAKVAKAIGSYFERVANTHPLSKPLDHATKVRLVKQSLSNQHHQYYIMRNDQRMMREYRESMRQCNLEGEIATIPTKILTEMKANEFEAAVLPSHLREEIMYIEQFEHVLPREQYHRKMAISRLIRAYEGQSEVPEEEEIDVPDMPKHVAEAIE